MVKSRNYNGYHLEWTSRSGYWTVYEGDSDIRLAFYRTRQEAELFVDTRRNVYADGSRVTPPASADQLTAKPD